MPAQPHSFSAAAILIEKQVSGVRNKVSRNWATCNSHAFMQTMKILFLFCSFFFGCQKTDFPTLSEHKTYKLPSSTFHPSISVRDLLHASSLLVMGRGGLLNNRVSHLPSLTLCPPTPRHHTHIDVRFLKVTLTPPGL